MRILCFAGSRAEYYILRPLFIKLSSYEEISLEIIISGGITREKDHKTLKDIENDNLNILDVINIPKNLINHSQTIGFLCTELDKLISKNLPDLCIVYGDRYESFAFAIAATHLNTVLLHIEAGDITEGGTYDDFIRHCITKMSHLFCASTKKGVNNVQRLGEESWRIIQSGLLSYDDMSKITDKDRDVIKKEFDIREKIPIILATMHPTTINLDKTKYESKEFFNALKSFSKKYDCKLFLTAPNLDNGYQFINSIIQDSLKDMRNTTYVESLGGFRYQTLMSFASYRKVIVCGNSSSVIKEAPFYGADSLNVGTRQMGRESASTQVNCDAKEKIIFKNLKKLIDSKNTKIENPYYVKNSADKIIKFIFYIFENYSKDKILTKKWNFNFDSNKF